VGEVRRHRTLVGWRGNVNTIRRARCVEASGDLVHFSLVPQLQREAVATRVSACYHSIGLRKRDGALAQPPRQFLQVFHGRCAPGDSAGRRLGHRRRRQPWFFGEAQHDAAALGRFERGTRGRVLQRPQAEVGPEPDAPVQVRDRVGDFLDSDDCHLHVSFDRMMVAMQGLRGSPKNGTTVVRFRTPPEQPPRYALSRYGWNSSARKSMHSRTRGTMCRSRA
jgi:hypothetical protein